MTPVLLYFLALVAPGSGGGGGRRRRAAAPNIVLVMNEDQRRPSTTSDDQDGNRQRQDYANCLPHHRCLRDQGAAFINHCADLPQCGPSRAATRTGRLPHNTQLCINTTGPGGPRRIKTDDESGRSTVATLSPQHVFALPPSPFPPCTPDQLVVRERLVLPLLPSTAARAAAVAKAAASLRRSLLPNGSWADVRYKDKTRGTWAATTHLTRLKSMAAAVRAPLSPSAMNSTALLESVNKGLAFWLQGGFRNPNWSNLGPSPAAPHHLQCDPPSLSRPRRPPPLRRYWNEIGVPQLLADTFLLLEGRGLSAADIKLAVSSIAMVWPAFPWPSHCLLLPFRAFSLPFAAFPGPSYSLSLHFLELSLPFLDLSLPFLDLPLPFLDLPLPFARAARLAGTL